VLHLRADHSPYEEYIPSRFRSKTYDRSNYHQYKLKSYIDSVKYVDFVVANIFKFMDKTDQPFKVYFTSDHAEMFGSKKEQGRYGHSVLDIEAARVPFLCYSNKPVDINITKTNHYKIGNLILNDLGYNLENPNQKKDIFYLNGVKLDGSAGFLEYNLSKVIP
jgi:glucan phosphoethanolaminetransferase (alkaline phosphatase superfamily)